MIPELAVISLAAVPQPSSASTPASGGAPVELILQISGMCCVLAVLIPSTNFCPSAAESGTGSVGDPRDTSTKLLKLSRLTSTTVPVESWVCT